MYREWKPYVPVAQRRAQAVRYAKQLAKKARRQVEPIVLATRHIASTFWGKAWCDNLESYSDYANRLPRGRTYLRNGSVVDLRIEPGKVHALVGGSEVYTVLIEITRLKPQLWTKVKNDCGRSIDTVLDLLGGRFSESTMQRLTRQQDGLFPKPAEISIDCSCPDWAQLCKHAAAVLYGVGNRLDERPELLFLLREVDHTELVSQAVSQDNLDAALGAPQADLQGEDLSALFGIELDQEGTGQQAPPPPAKAKSSRSRTGSTRTKAKRVAQRATTKATRSEPRAAKKRTAKSANRSGGKGSPKKAPRQPSKKKKK